MEELSRNQSTERSGEQSRRNLDLRMVSGIKWTAVSKWGSQMVSWLILPLLASFLSPRAFGLLSMTTLLLGVVTLISESGLSGTIIVSAGLSESKIKRLNTTAVLFGLAGSLVMVIAAPLLATFFRSPELMGIAPAMGLLLTITGLRIVPRALLTKEMHFRRVSSVEAIQAVVQGMTAVLLAWWGWSYWSLVISNLVGASFTTISLCWFRPVGFAFSSFHEIREELTFSRQLLVGQLSWYGYANSDFAIVGRQLGDAALGVYSVAWNIANVPVEKLSNLFSSVAPAIYSKVQTQPAEIRRYLRLLTEGVSLVAFPAGVGIALVSRTLVEVVFDERYTGAYLPLAFLGLSSAIRSIGVLVSPVIVQTGGVRFIMWQSIGALLVFPLAFYFASHWGIAGVGVAWLCVYPMVAMPLFWKAFRTTDMKVAEYLGSVLPAVGSCAVMALAVLGVQYLTAGIFSGILKLLVEVGTGVISYVSMLALLHRNRIKEVAAAVLRS